MGGYRPLKPSNSSLLLIYWDRLVTGLPPTPVPTAAAPPPQPPAETQAPTATEQPASPEKAAHPFVLPSAPRGDLVSLESYVGQKNVVLVFYRGFW